MLWCLHGFLGLGSDWEGFDFGSVKVARPSLFGEIPEQSLAAWGKTFATHVTAVDRHPIIMGYSMGGRLALHALIAKPDIWKAAVMISAHPGLSSSAERAARMASDEEWARRFATDDWKSVIAAWYGQTIFGGRERSERRAENLYSRAALAQSLRLWSVGRQKDLRPALATISCPVLWVVGAEDKKFVQVAHEAVKILPRATLWEVPGCFHWVAWEKPREFEAKVKQFIGELTNDASRKVDVD